mgnify:FL=1
MKKVLSVIIVCVLTVSLIGCGSSETENRGNSAAANDNTSMQTDVTEGTDFEAAQGSEITESEQSAAQDKTTGLETAETGTAEPESDTAGDSDAEPSDAEHGREGSNALIVYFSWSGNTENVANAIAGQTGADVFEIVPEEAYTPDYNALLDIAAEEKENGARPAIAGSIDDISRYDIIYVGYPNWWSDMPMILYTFFDSYDLSGKTLAPFCTSGGSGLSGTVSSIRELEPEADVLDGLHIGSSAASDPDQAVSDWLESLEIME